MKRLFVILIVVLVLVLVTGCSNELKLSSSTSKNYEELINLVNDNHKKIVKPKANFDEFISSYKPKDILWDNDNSNKVPYDGNQTLTHDEIVEDINYLYQCLSDGYGLYNYFGGDEVFDASKDKLLEEYKNKDSESLAVFLDSILDNLSFVKDFHFNIYEVRTNKLKLPYIFDGFECQKVDGKFINSKNNKIVKSINKSDKLDDIFRLSISSEGKLVYYPTIISDNLIYSMDIAYSDEAVETITYTKDSYYHKFNEELKLDIKSDIPIIHIGKMGFDKGTQGDNAKQFLDYATKYKDEKIVIVDLRNNYGGNGMLPQKWMMNYASEFVPTNYFSLKYITLEQIKKNINPSNINYQSIDELVNIYGLEQISDSYSKVLDQKDEFIANDNLLIILVNKNTYSAGEMFVDIAHNLENTIVVGTNTAGCLIGDHFGFITLPNSKLPVSFGNGLSFFPDNYFEEFEGFKPDIWVKGDAEEAVFKLIKNLKIQ